MKLIFKHFCCLGASWAVVIGVVLGSTGVVRGQEGFGGFLRSFFGRDGANEAAMPTLEAIEDDVPADFVNQFTPLLTQLLTAELHFADKVCELDDEQLKKLHQIGKAKVAAIAKLYEKEQNRHQSSEWPDARDLLTDAFQEQLTSMLTPDVAERYRTEIAGRRQAKREAAREMITMLMDRKVSLKPEQYEPVDEALQDNWDPAWSTNMQIYLYDEYAPMPDPHVLRTVLTERQQSILASRANHGRISFGWEQDLGLMTPWGDVGELEVEIPADDPPPPAQKEEGGE